MIEFDQWPGNTFRLWLPEHVGQIWFNWDVHTAHQEFSRTRNGGLLWSFQTSHGANIESEVIPDDASLTLEVRVTAGADVALHDLAIVNCLQFPLAPDFACGDFSRIFIRTSGVWRSLAELQPKTDYPHYFRDRKKRSDGKVGWGGDMGDLFETIQADHPLMVCVARDGTRAVGTASDHCEYVFHNRANPNLWCIHSTQAPAPIVKPGQTVAFRQRVYFVNGGLPKCVRASEDDLVPD